MKSLLAEKLESYFTVHQKRNFKMLYLVLTILSCFLIWKAKYQQYYQGKIRSAILILTAIAQEQEKLAIFDFPYETNVGCFCFALP